MIKYKFCKDCKYVNIPNFDRGVNYSLATCSHFDAQELNLVNGVWEEVQ